MTLKFFVAFTIGISLLPQQVQSQGLVVNCDSGGTIRGSLGSMKPGDTLTVNGTCSESVAIEGEVSRITLDGGGRATILSPNPTLNAIAIRGREITIRGFTIVGGNFGVIIQRGATAVVDGNIIRSNAASGILVGPESSASIINNTIENNRSGISIDENSYARIGWQVPTVLGLPNTIQNNSDNGIWIVHNSSARIIGATIRNNGMDGVRVERASHADVTDSNISGNAGNGITVTGNSGIDFDFGRTQAVAQPNTTDAGRGNGAFGITCSIGSYLSGSPGTLTGAKGAMDADSTCIHGLGPLVGGLLFEPPNVSLGASFTATFSGTGLSPQTYFDIRFRTPGSNNEEEASNWQQGPTAVHTVPGSMQTGTYVITAVRGHKESSDHAGSYLPVSVSLTVRP